MKIAITGADGQLGQALRRALSGFDVIPLDQSSADVTDFDAVRTAVTAAAPDVVVHCAAYTDVDGCARDPERAYRVNGLGAQNVALACRAAGAAMVHISTNEVFAGDRPEGYLEWMPLSPINGYGRSKAAAEIFVRQALDRCYVVRTAWLYAPGGRNFIHTILNRARQDGRLRVVADEVGNPTYVRDLAAAIGQLIPTGRYGTYHFVNAGSCSRWAFANEILRLAGLDGVDNRPILSREFRRDSTPPPFAALHNLAGAAIGIRLRPWPEALAAYMVESGEAA